jgi:hypothetical protein
MEHLLEMAILIFPRKKLHGSTSSAASLLYLVVLVKIVMVCSCHVIRLIPGLSAQARGIMWRISFYPPFYFNENQ